MVPVPLTDSHTFVATGKAGRNARTLRGTRKRPIRFQWMHFNRGSLHTNFSLVCNDLWFVARSGRGRFATEVAGREKKSSSKKLRTTAPPSAKWTDPKGSYRRSLYFIPSRCVYYSRRNRKEGFSKRDEYRARIGDFMRPFVS